MNLEDFLIDKSKDTYILEVDGDSMIDAHIADGDMVIVERANKAKDGEYLMTQQSWTAPEIASGAGDAFPWNITRAGINPG